jgi:hypothetical protein
MDGIPCDRRRADRREGGIVIGAVRGALAGAVAEGPTVRDMLVVQRPLFEVNGLRVGRGADGGR